MEQFMLVLNSHFFGLKTFNNSVTGVDIAFAGSPCRAVLTVI